MAEQQSIERVFMEAVQDGIRAGVEKRLTAEYNSPLAAVVTEAIKDELPTIKILLSQAIKQTILDIDFRTEIAAAVRQQMAKQLVQKFGGELEKQINALKSDPTTRARIVLALEDIVADAERQDDKDPSPIRPV